MRVCATPGGIRATWPPKPEGPRLSPIGERYGDSPGRYRVWRGRVEDSAVSAACTQVSKVVDLSEIESTWGGWRGESGQREQRPEDEARTSIPEVAAFSGYSVLPAQEEKIEIYVLGANIYTALVELAREAEQRIELLLTSARDEAFEDGVESEFSRGLTDAVRLYGLDAVKAIGRFLTTGKANAEVAGEALRRLGMMEDNSTHVARRKLLEGCLISESAGIRDAAALGLSFMDDPKSIGALEKSVAREKCQELREDLVRVLDQLEATAGVAVPEENTQE